MDLLLRGGKGTLGEVPSVAEVSQLLTGPVQIFCSALDTILGILPVYMLLNYHWLLKSLCSALLIFEHGF